MGSVKNTAYECWEMAQCSEEPDWDYIASETGLPDGDTAKEWAEQWNKLEQ